MRAVPLLALLASCTATVCAADEAQRPHWRRNLFVRVLEDQKALLQSWWPAELQRPAFVVPFAGAAAMAAGSRGGLLDEQRWTADGPAEASTFFSTLGERDTAFLLVGTTWLASRWAGNQRMQRASSLSAEALIDAGLYSTVLKRVAQRRRPAEAGDSPNSFPSGHASGAFALATVLAGEFRDRRWVPWVAYGTAGLVAASRVSLGRHFPSDVIAGAALGNSLGRMVLQREGLDERERGDTPQVVPLVDPHGGVGLAWRREW